MYRPLEDAKPPPTSGMYWQLVALRPHLTPDDHRLIVWRLLNRYSLRRIAKLTGLHASTVCRRIRKALRRAPQGMAKRIVTNRPKKFAARYIPKNQPS